MPTFPLRQRPPESFRQAPRSFGSRRDRGKRKHSGCDLYAAAGAEVLACEDGTVVRGPYPFYDVVSAIEIRHGDGRILRYGEISGAADGVKAGGLVKEGQVIAYVGKMETISQAMLHVELYAGTAVGPLTDRQRPLFMRRADLVDPTEYLDSAALESVASAEGEQP